MATIDHPVTTPLSFKTVTVNASVAGSDDTDDLSPQIGELTFTPTAASGSWTGVGGNVVSDLGIATWAVTLGMIQDISVTGMLRWLLTNEGKKCTFTAVLVIGVTVTFTATLSPATIGGAVTPGYLTSTVQLAMDGKPAFS
ncbi:MAG: hypothetical protein IPL41_01415 [Micropruina sp.]|nr:hypothetical protein [Micropruina sp.]